MIINDLEKYTSGYLEYYKKEDYLLFNRFIKSQRDHLEKVSDFLYVRTYATASIKISLNTAATNIKFDYKIYWIGSIDSIDIFVDDLFYKSIQLSSNIKEGKIDFDLPKGNKIIDIYLPIDLELGIKNFEINDKYENVIKPNKTLLAMGDSITHGFGSNKTGFTYINVLNRELKYNLINQGIGGYWFDDEMVPLLKNKIQPDLIVVSLGTNQLWSSDKYDRIDKFFKNLDETFKNVETFVISPIYRCDKEDGMFLIEDMYSYLIKITSKYTNIHLIDGRTLVPNDPYFFIDGLHPNLIGMELYGIELYKRINKKSL